MHDNGIIERLAEVVRSTGGVTLADLRKQLRVNYSQFRRAMRRARELRGIAVIDGVALPLGIAPVFRPLPSPVTAESRALDYPPAHNQRRPAPDRQLVAELEALLIKDGPLHADIARERLCVASAIRFESAVSDLVKTNKVERIGAGVIRLTADTRPAPRWNADWAYQPCRRRRAAA